MKRIIITFAALSFANLAMADTIYLKDGIEKHGTVLKLTPSVIEYRPEGDKPVESIPTKEAVRIKYEDGRSIGLSSKDRESGLMNKFKSAADTQGLLQNHLLIWGGAHNHIYGYRDSRYLDQNDNFDYIKTDSQQMGIELNIAGLSDIDPAFSSTRMGFNIAGYRHDKIKPRTLYSVPLHNIPEETVPAPEKDAFDNNIKWWYDFGFFIGIDKKVFAFDLGLTLRTILITEEKRKKLRPDSDPDAPQYDEVDGRGLMFDDANAALNALLRLGMEDRTHITFTAFRASYDPVYGAVQGKVSFPIATFFTLNTGAYFWQTKAAFLEPEISLYGIALAYKAGLILNYRDKEIKNLSIKDCAFHSVSLAYQW